MTERTPRNLLSELAQSRMVLKEQKRSLEEAKSNLPVLTGLMDALIPESDNRLSISAAEFTVPPLVPDEEPFVVNIRRNSRNNEPLYTIGIHDTNEALHITGGIGLVIVRTMFSPADPNRELGQTQRPINMSDFEAYNALLQRLSHGDVAMKPKV